MKSVELGAGVEESLAILQRCLKDEERGGLSISQTGGLLALVCMRSGTNLGEYLKRSIKPGSDDGNRGRQREVLPLPLWTDGKEQLRSLFESGDFRKFGGADKKAFRHARRAGLLIWHCLTVVLLNFLWTGGGKQAKVHQGTTSVSQARALDRIWEILKASVDDSCETKSKVPCSPEMGEWGREVGDVGISYQGEIVEKGQRLTLDLVLPGLPPEGEAAESPEQLIAGGGDVSGDTKAPDSCLPGRMGEDRRGDVQAGPGEDCRGASVGQR